MMQDASVGQEQEPAAGRRTGRFPKAAPTPLGAEVIGDQTRFRVFTDQARACQVRFLNADGSVGATHALDSVGDGFFETRVPNAPHGTLYDVLLDGQRYPDPYARFLPEGVNGPAMVVEDRYAWRNGPGIARPLRDQVIYEIHVGTFTDEGTYAAAVARLPGLVDLGVTAVELLPLSSFPGTRGWGYDGVAHFAPYSGYGTPDELRAFIDEAHGLGLSVLLDAVYNHFGPSGNYLTAYSRQYFSAETPNAWGDGPNFGHPVMRSYVLDNARYWLTSFRFDGLRLDATHAINDSSPIHILKEVAEMAHGLSPRKLVIAEDERNEPAVVTKLGMDGIWADDFHHVAHVLMTNENDGYYGCYTSTVEALAETIRKGWLYEGQVYPTTGRARGKSAAGLPPEAFVYCLQNHDQVGNRAFGDRLPVDANFPAYCAMSTVFLFLPMTPLLFMGQEWAATTPFQFFTDHDETLGALVSRGRRQEFQRFKAFVDERTREQIPDPQASDTFWRSKLKWEEQQQGRHAHALTLYKELLRLRRHDPVLSSAVSDAFSADAREGLLIVRRAATQPALDNRDGAGVDGQPHVEASASESPQTADRLLLANLSGTAIPAAVWKRELAGRRVILRSDRPGEAERANDSDTETDADGSLPPWTAIIAAGDPHA